ncbi:hypothetical protein PHMEG_00027065, partial [Phytophthora megakarya]
TGVEGLCVVLYRLAVPLRWVDMEETFRRHSSELSNLFLHVLQLLDKRLKRIVYFNREYAAQHLDDYAEALFRAGDVLTNIWAFIDITVRGICRPTTRNASRDGNFLSQHSVYSGHKRKLTTDEKSVNNAMSKVHVSVEWSSSHVVNYWTAIDFKQAQRAGITPVSQMYRVAVLLTNCITCVQSGNGVSDYFDLSPPSLHDYLRQ